MKIPQHSPVVLFRTFDIESEKELEICKKYFATTKSRMMATGGDLIVGRYSVLPFYKELERDLRSKGAKLINSFREHEYISDLKNWAMELDSDTPTLYGLTPRAWTRLQDLPDDIGPVVLKGQTNSRKELWSTHMYAANKKEAIEVYLRLKNERFFDTQEIYIREFIKLKTFFVDPINKQPITNEFRFFCYKREILAGGYYWSNHYDEIDPAPKASSVPLDFLDKIMRVVSLNATAYVVDVAQLENGEWICIEINDLQMSGLSKVNPDELYKNLKYHLWDKEFNTKEMLPP